MRPVLFLLSFALALPAVADEPTDEPSPAAPAPAADDGDGDAPPAKLKVLVLDLQTSGIDAGQAKLVDELLTVEIAKHESFDVLSGADVRRMVELEAEKQTIGCEDSSCLADIAGAMGARYVVYGRLGKLGSRLVLTLNLFDSESAGAVGRSELKPESMDELPDQLPVAVATLVSGLMASQKNTTETTSTTTTPPPPSAPVAKTEPASDEGPGAMAFVWPIGFAVAGVAVAGAGVGFDLLSPTSDDSTIEAGDFVGPAIIVVGLGTAVVGLVWNPFAGGDDA